jgi:hypothetical protein
MSHPHYLSFLRVNLRMSCHTTMNGRGNGQTTTNKSILRLLSDDDTAYRLHTSTRLANPHIRAHFDVWMTTTQDTAPDSTQQRMGETVLERVGEQPRIREHFYVWGVTKHTVPESVKDVTSLATVRPISDGETQGLDKIAVAWRARKVCGVRVQMRERQTNKQKQDRDTRCVCAGAKSEEGRQTETRQRW